MSALVGRSLFATALLGGMLGVFCMLKFAVSHEKSGAVVSVSESQPFVVASRTGGLTQPKGAAAEAGQQLEDVAHLARTIFAPRLNGLEVEGIERLPEILDRLRPPASSTFSTLLHSWHLFGDDLRVADLSGAEVPFRDVLMDSRIAKRHLGDVPIVAKTRYGVRFSLADRWQLSREQLNTEAHHGQALSLLAEQGVSRATRLAAPIEPAMTVQEILNDTLTSFIPTGEIAWDAVSLSVYLPPDSVWTNKFGDQYSFDKLAVALLESDPKQASCAGIHQCMSLSVMIRSDEVHRFLSSDIRASVIAYLSQCYSSLEQSQLPDGGWGVNWRTEPGRHVIPSTESVNDVVLATGHHLEWLALVPDHVHVDRRLVQRASIRLLNLLDQLSAEPEWVHEHYCPAIHAAKALVILTQREGAP